MSLFFLILFITFVWWVCGVQILRSYYPFLGENHFVDLLFATSKPWRFILAIGPIFLVFYAVAVIMSLLKKVKK